MSTVTYAGFSRTAGDLKFRTANDEKRIFALEKFGDTDINIVALPRAMTKSEAAKWCLTAEFFVKNPNVGSDVEALFVANCKDENPFAKAAKAPAKAKAVKTPQVPALKGMTPLGIKPATVVVKNAVLKTASNESKERAKFIAKLFKDIVDA